MALSGGRKTSGLDGGELQILRILKRSVCFMGSFFTKPFQEDHFINCPRIRALTTSAAWAWVAPFAQGLQRARRARQGPSAVRLVRAATNIAACVLGNARRVSWKFKINLEIDAIAGYTLTIQVRNQNTNEILKTKQDKERQATNNV
jgi:hypothetical protein